MKWTSRQATMAANLWRRAMSSMFSKYPSLLFEILLNNVQQHLQSGQLDPLPTSNGAEITRYLIPLKESRISIAGLFNSFEGLFSPFERLFRPFEGLFRPFEGLLSPFEGLFPRIFSPKSCNDIFFFCTLLESQLT